MDFEFGFWFCVRYWIWDLGLKLDREVGFGLGVGFDNCIWELCFEDGFFILDEELDLILVINVGFGYGYWV